MVTTNIIPGHWLVTLWPTLFELTKIEDKLHSDIDRFCNFSVLSSISVVSSSGVIIQLHFRTAI